jgi:STE24 endopeptidase
MSTDFALTEAAWTAFFCLLLVAHWVVKVWLASRQIRHVAAHQQTVPLPFSQTIELPAHQRAARYTIAKTRHSMLSTTLGAVTLVAWTLLGGLNLLNQTLEQWLGHGLLQQLALLTAFTLMGALVELPLSWYATFRVEERFGFNKMSWGLWISDGIKGLLVAAVLGLPMAAAVLWLMETSGPFWWLWAWAVWTGFSLLLMVVYPTWIAPLFNQFKPIDDETLKSRVQNLMQRCGFQARGLFVMDGSKRSAHANAYFTGLGPAKRVVFFDTLLAQLTPNELDAVLAHELGHFKHRHVIKRMLTVFAMSLLGFAILGVLYSQTWFYTGLGVQPNMDAPNSALALILFLSVAPLAAFFVTPLMSHSSRQHEFEADAYAVSQTSGPDLANALLKLYQDNANTLTPDPLFVKFYYSHPPANERLTQLVGSPAA